MTQPRTSQRLFTERLASIQRDADRLFFWLLLAQWVFAIALALTASPYAWVGRTKSVHIHVQIAVVFGALLNALPLALIYKRPASPLTRHVVAAAQMLWSAVLIDITGGRIETHFHVFGSLAFLTFYRDVWVLATATTVVVLDHLVRGLFWPDALYGAANPEWWRFLEHASWVLFEVVVLTINTLRIRRDMLLLADGESELEAARAAIELKVEERTKELEESRNRYRALVENTDAIPWEIDPTTFAMSYIAPQATRVFGCTAEDLLPDNFMNLVHEDDRERMSKTFLANIERGRGESIDYRVVSRDRGIVHLRTTVGAHVKGEPLRGITLDISRQVKLEAELRQAHKLESMGRLAAGVAHEINTPVQFVSDSVHFVKRAADDTFALLASAQSALHRVAAGASAEEEAVALEARAESIDLAFVQQQVPRALDLALDGLSRVTTIVRSMKEFAYPHTAFMAEADLNQAVRSTLTIARGEYKMYADLETQFGELPRVCCHVGDINQVVLNLVVNAAHAIAAKKSDDKGTIRVRTEHDGEHVTISVADTGVGIPEHLTEQVYDPFFTTKDIGKGTGQGLSLARTIVVERHGGQLWFESKLGEGTTFFVRLPVARERVQERPAA